VNSVGKSEKESPRSRGQERRGDSTSLTSRSARILAFGQPWGQGKRRGVVDALDTEDDDDPERFKVLVVEEV